MKYIRDRLNYFRENDSRIENMRDFNEAVKVQNDSEPIPEAEVADRIKIVFLSLFVVVVLVLLFVFGFNFINSLDDPNQIFENKAVLLSFCGIFFTVGLLFFAISIVNALMLKVKCTQESEATCIGYDDVVITNKHGAHFESCPVYRFNDAGTEYTVYDKKYTRYTTKLPDIGSVESILFDPENPNRCIINNKVNWRIPAIIIGVCFLFFSFLLYFGVVNGL